MKNTPPLNTLFAGFKGKESMNGTKDAEIARLRDALQYVISDLEMRSSGKRGDEKGIVDIGDGAYMQAKAALTQQEPK